MTEPEGHVDREPVDLDTNPTPPEPSAELARWSELVAVEVEVDHEGDVSKLTSLPRPSWSDPYEDSTSTSLSVCNYRSESAQLALTAMQGIHRGGWWTPAKVEVNAKLYGDGAAGVGVEVSKYIKGERAGFGFSLTVDEAHELASLLLAAADLAVSE